MAKKNIKTLKKELWRLTSEYVRRRDHKEFQAGEGKSLSSEMSKCVTCGLVKPWRELQAGHFIPKAQGNAIYFDTRNIHTQCYRCNINLGGNGPEYYPFMVGRYGEFVVEELRQLSNTTVKYKQSDYEDMIKDMKQKLSELDEM